MRTDGDLIYLYVYVFFMQNTREITDAHGWQLSHDEVKLAGAFLYFLILSIYHRAMIVSFRRD